MCYEYSENSGLFRLFRFYAAMDFALLVLGRFVDCPCCCESAFVPAFRSVAHCTFCDSWFEVDVLQKDDSI